MTQKKTTPERLAAFSDGVFSVTIWMTGTSVRMDGGEIKGT